MRKRTSTSLLGVLLFLWPPRPGPAGEGVPPSVQANLLVRVAPFDRSLSTLPQIQVLVVARRDDPGSQHVADAVYAALKNETQIAGVPMQLARIEVTSVPHLLSEIRGRKPSIVYLSTEFSRDAPAIAAGLDGEHLLTFAAESEAVRGGICVGFDLSFGRPQVLVHLEQSRRQHAKFQSGFLHLAKVVDQ
ncbi:MAG TPA: YfiR/HmsC family protein [Myxococcales bacterium]|nr:YfiR/HmsC family protein [Myxococcales bacterium]